MRIRIATATVLLALFTGTALAAVELAKVNGRPVTDKDLQMALGNLNEGQRSSVLKDSNSRRQVLMSVIDQEVLSQEAEKQKLDQDQDYKDSLAQFRKNYLAQKVVTRNLGAKLNDKTVKRHYELHKDQYSTDSVHIQHILVNDEASARDMLKKAKDADNDFMELAEKYSKDPSAKNNRGDIGPITRDGPFVKEFKDAAFNGSPGEIVGPVKTAYGYHIIKVVAKKTGKPLEFHEVELRVRNDLQAELVTEYVGKLKTQGKITVDDKALDKL